MRYRLTNSRGISLIELTIMLVVIGILTAVAMKTMTTAVEDARRTKTEREMEMLTKGIVGDPTHISSSRRADFGYLGDIGAFPPNLTALMTNPGYGTWKGPYLPAGYVEDTNGYQLDEWGSAYTYTGGLTISSSGHGTPMVKKIADATSDYLLNAFTSYVKDASESPPGSIKKDSVNVRVTIPNGTGDTVTKTYRPLASGLFRLDSMPVGQHALNIIYVPQSDTLVRSITVLPRQRTSSPVTYKFAQPYFAGTLAGLFAYWKLDDGSGAIAVDASGNGHTGTLVNMNTSTAWIAGKVNGALRFDGVNDYVRIGNVSPTGGITVSAWVNPSSIGVDRQIVSKGFNGTRTQWELKTTTADGKVSFRHWAPGAVGVESLQRLTAGVWTHVAATYDGATWKIYWNGVLDNQANAGGPVATTRNLCIGCVDINGTPGQFWIGAIDEVKIFDRALSASEIATLAL